MSDGKSPVNRIAVDIGNSRIKFGQFRCDTKIGAHQGALPEPAAVFDLPIMSKAGDFDVRLLSGWANANSSESTEWFIASVHRGAAERLTSALKQFSVSTKAEWLIRELSYRD